MSENNNESTDEPLAVYPANGIHDFYEVREPLLIVEDVSLRLGNKLIFRDVNLTINNLVRPASGIKQGQVVSFFGPSGIGKTQFSFCLCGLQPPTTGRILITKDEVPVRYGIVGNVPQDYILFAHRTVFSALMLAATRKYPNKAERKDKVMSLLEELGLVDKVKFYPKELSGGQRQRVSIAEQLLSSEHFLIMDEPFTGLDPKAKRSVCDLIQRVSVMDELNTIIIICHDIKPALAVADTAWLMGYQNDEEGKRIPGATVVGIYDLIQMGFAWHKDVYHEPGFIELVQEIEETKFG